MNYQLYTVYTQDHEGTTTAELTVRARCHEQNIYTHTTLVGVTATGAERLAHFCRSAITPVQVDVPGGPILDGWRIDQPSTTKGVNTMNEYAGWIIRYEYDEAGLGDLSGVNAAASIKRFGEVVENYLRTRYPGADITVSLHNLSNGAGRPVVMRPDYDGVDSPEEQAAADYIEDIAGRIFESGSWIVEA